MVDPTRNLDNFLPTSDPHWVHRRYNILKQGSITYLWYTMQYKVLFDAREKLAMLNIIRDSLPYLGGLL